MNNCTDQQYWDTLVCQCIPCSLVCGRPAVRRCAALCGECGPTATRAGMGLGMRPWGEARGRL